MSETFESPNKFDKVETRWEPQKRVYDKTPSLSHQNRIDLWNWIQKDINKTNFTFTNRENQEIDSSIECKDWKAFLTLWEKRYEIKWSWETINKIEMDQDNLRIHFGDWNWINSVQTASIWDFVKSIDNIWDNKTIHIEGKNKK